jgi:CBS domain-containing protein
VAARGGLPIEAVREKYRSDRDAATQNQIRGAAAIVEELVAQGRAHGVIGIGGGTATLVATSVMKRLPFGMPKLMASPMAAHPAYIDKYVGTRDITMHHTVLDIVKMNPLLKAQIINAVGAICGMVEMTQGTDIKFDRPCVAVSSFGFGEMAVQAALGLLEQAGFTPVVCHAQGKGDRAMEEMIRDGVFHGVLDLCTGGVMEHLFKGNRDPGPERLMAAVETGIPMVLAPCGLDILSYGGRADMLEKTRTGRSTCRTRCACGAHHGRGAATGGRGVRRAAQPRARPMELPRAVEGLVVARQGRPADLRPGSGRGVRSALEGKARRPEPRERARPAPVHPGVRARRGGRVRSALRRQGGKAMLVRDWMRPDPATIPGDTLVTEAKRVLVEQNLHALPVVEQGKLRGLVTRHILLRAGHYVLRTQDPDELDFFATRLMVKDIMVRNPATVEAGDTMQHCLRKGRELGVAQFPVMEGGQVVGIISANEIFQLAAHCVERQA